MIMSAIMMAMKINVARVIEHDGMAHAHVQVDVPEIMSRALITMHFPAPVRSHRADWEEIAYDKALLMLDPA